MAIAVFEGKINGTVKFEGKILIYIQLKGLNKNALHGFHIHEAGDLTDKCESMCAHFNHIINHMVGMVQRIDM